jgi:predicted nucleic acid-binding protein
MIVADTDVLIDYLEGCHPGSRAVASALAAGKLQTTVITCYELFSGARQPRKYRAVQNLLQAIPILPLDEGMAQRAAEVRRDLEGSGVQIGMADSLVAGMVLHQKAALLTRNRRHFERVPHLRLAELAEV